MQVPGSFKLGARTWRVDIVESLQDSEGKLLWGLCHGDEARIELRRTDNPEQLEHTFWHELVHALCFTVGYATLNEDEDHVDAIGNMLMQFIHTKKGQPEG